MANISTLNTNCHCDWMSVGITLMFDNFSWCYFCLNLCNTPYRQKCQLSSTLFHHWRQTKHLEQSYRAGVWRLSHQLCPCREESPAQRKVGEPLCRTSLDQLFVQQKCTVMYKMAGNNLQLQLSSLQGSSTLHGPPDWESRNWWVHKFI
jgi:hypothetical protein